MKNFRHFFISCLLLLITHFASGQSISISINPLEYCRPEGGGVDVNVNVTTASLPGDGAPYTYRVYKTGQAGSIGGPYNISETTRTFKGVNGDRTYFAKLFNKDDGEIATSNQVSFTVKRTPDALEENNGEGATETLNITDAPYILNKIVKDPDDGFTISFQGIGTAAPAVERVGNSNTYHFNPSKVPPGSYQVQYTLSEGHCSITERVKNITFIVVDATASLPTFLKAIDPVPICENNTSFTMYAYINKFCLTEGGIFSSTPSSIKINLMYTAGVTTQVTGTRVGSDGTVTGSSAIYSFKINPSLHQKDVYSIYIEIPTNNCTGMFKGYIPLFPRRNPLLLGLPSVINENEINICSASYDTIFMRGNPKDGSYNYYKGIPNGINYDYSKIPVSISPYEPPGDERSLQKFVPATVFKEFADSLIENVIKVVYTFPGNGSGSCPDSVTRIFKFLPGVATAFTKPISTPYCYGDTIALNVINSNTGDKFSWSFGDGFSKAIDSSIVLKHFYNAPGVYAIRFKTQIATLPPGTCNNDIIDTIRIGAQPLVDFDVFKNFIDSASVLHSKAYINVASLANKVDDMDTIVTWHWDFGTLTNDQHLSTIRGDTVFAYKQIQKNPFVVKHTATAKWGCEASRTRNIPVFPVKKPLPSLNIIDTFTVTDINGWFESGQYKNTDTTSSWQNKTPNELLISEFPGGGNAWITSENKSDTSAGYYHNENSWIESPAYDIRQLKLPMVALNTWTNTDNLFDGASLQYAFCDSIAFGKEKWHSLGTVNKGLGWYNSNTVIGKPGNNLLGWTGDTSTTWQLSAYRLNHLLDSLNKPQKKRLLRFRVALGTNYDNTPGKKFDGFAFDNFFVGERNRKVIVEEFCDYERYKDDIQDEFKDPQAIRIQYHVGTHTKNDSITLANRAEPSARALHYGVGYGLPRLVLDGILSNNTTEFNKKKDDEILKWGPDEFLKRSLYTSPFKISVDPVVENDQLKIISKVENISTLPIKGPFVVQVAILEREVYTNGLSEPFTNVLRNMVPNAAGNRIRKNYFNEKNDTTFTSFWSPFVTPTSDILVVVFIQDEDTKEIYQSNYDSIEYVLAKDLPLVRPRNSIGSNIPTFNEVTLSPNPTSGNVTLLFNGILIDYYTCTISDSYGKVLRSEQLGKNISAAMISTSDLTSGLYYLTIEGQGQRIVKKFSVIK